MVFSSLPLLDAVRPDGAFADRGATMAERAQRSAALLLRVPVATVCLLDGGGRGSAERDGLPAGALSFATSPAAALYAEVVRRRGALAVADAAAMVVPAMATALRALAWQSFLGVPLLGPGGVVRGVLAVADVVPRSWRADEIAALADLAALVADAHAGPDDEGARWIKDVAQREAQEARRKSEQWLALVFNGTADLTFLMDVDGDGFRCLAVNESYLAVTGYAEAEVVGRTIWEILPPAAAERAAERYRAVVRDGEPMQYEEIVRLPVGEVQVETLLTPISGEDGRCRYLLGVARDVTARRRAEDGLRAAKDDAERARVAAETARREAERASQAKSDFLSRMSHELRTPLNSVIGFANVLRNDRTGRRDEREAAFLDRIVANGEHLLALVGDLLDIARIEAGRLPLAPSPVPIGALVRATVASFEPETMERPVLLRAETPASAGSVVADPTRLQQVLVNLVANALRRTPRGTVTVRLLTDDADGRPLRLEVEDTGVGIAPERLDAVFEPFEQGSVGGGGQGDSGLGLAISRSLCEHMGFALRVRSTMGQGSVFAIEFESERRA